MSYDVDWELSARHTLATIWINAVNRQAITSAQVRIDRLLRADPLGNGQPLSEGLYTIDVHPLRAVFEMDELRRSVTVVSVSELA